MKIVFCFDKTNLLTIDWLLEKELKSSKLYNEENNIPTLTEGGGCIVADSCLALNQGM